MRMMRRAAVAAAVVAVTALSPASAQTTYNIASMADFTGPYADVMKDLIGSQRPASGLSTDAAINLVNGVRVAAAPESRGRGVLLMLNDEIQAAREVTETSNWRMQTFRTPDFGALGDADADRIAYYRRPERKHMPDTEFDVTGLTALPRALSFRGEGC